MSSILDSDLSLLYQALASPLGIVIHCLSPESARQRLYKARKEDAALAQLQFRLVASNSEELWIVREHVQVASGQQEPQPNA